MQFIGFMACLQKQWVISISQLISNLTEIDQRTRQFSNFIQLINKKSMASQFSHFEHDPPSKQLFEALYSPEVSAALFNARLDSNDNLGDQQNSPNNENISIRQEKFSQDRTTIKKQQVEKVGCNCKKISCLKMYCQCLALGRACGQACKCHSCKNNGKSYIQKQNSSKKKPINEVKKQMRKCKCRKSQCQRKYCDCFRFNEGCSEFCECIGCKNRVDLYTTQNQMIKKEINIQEDNNLPFGKIQLFNSEDDIDRFYA